VALITAVIVGVGGFDRDRAVYPILLIVTASYYMLFAVMARFDAAATKPAIRDPATTEPTLRFRSIRISSLKPGRRRCIPSRAVTAIERRPVRHGNSERPSVRYVARLVRAVERYCVRSSWRVASRAAGRGVNTQGGQWKS